MDNEIDARGLAYIDTAQIFDPSVCYSMEIRERYNHISDALSKHAQILEQDLFTSWEIFLSRFIYSGLGGCVEAVPRIESEEVRFPVAFAWVLPNGNVKTLGTADQ
ncbi:hypothetical protein HK096_008209, partial [Nowakowskiella sp. JEL0078]